MKFNNLLTRNKYSKFAGYDNENHVREGEVNELVIESEYPVVIDYGAVGSNWF